MTTAGYSINTRYRLGHALDLIICGGQPAPKWIKDGILVFEEITSQRIIKAMTETERGLWKGVRDE